MKNKIYIIGTGKVGSSFAHELNDAGYQTAFLTDRNLDRLKMISTNLQPEISHKIEKEFIADADIILICVQDRYIKYILEKINWFGIELNEKYFFHTSGSESTEVFSLLTNKFIHTASIHPIQTFGKVSFENNHLLNNIYFGVEGEGEGKILSLEIVKKLNSKYIEIPKDRKYLYHSACVISSNFLITLLNISSEIISSIGIDKNLTFEVFKPIIEKTLSNISEEGLVNSLTGPFERNDVETISNHLNSINKELPSLLPFYTLLGMETVKVAFKKESLNLKNVISILDLMNKYIANEINPERQIDLNYPKN